MVVIAASGQPGNDALWSLAGAPLCEEAVFRAGIQGPLARRIGTPAAILVTSALFAAAHAARSPWHLAAATFLPSIALGVVYAASGRLRHAVGLHAFFNAAWWLVGSDVLRPLAS